MEKTDQIMEKLQKLKNECKLTNQQIGELSGLSSTTVQRYLSGTIKDAPIDTISKIIVAMGGEPKEILGISLPPMDRSAEIDLYERVITSLKERHAEALERLQVSYADRIREYRKWVRILAIIVGLLILVIMILFLIDILNPEVGWIREILNSWDEVTTAFSLKFMPKR